MILYIAFFSLIILQINTIAFCLEIRKISKSDRFSIVIS